MQATNILYEEHRYLLERAATGLMKTIYQKRSAAKHLAKDDLIQAGAEKWIVIVSAWSGQDGPDLRRLLHRACRNAMINHLWQQWRHIRRAAPEADAADVVDETQEIGLGRIEMGKVHGLPSPARALVMQALDIGQEADGTYHGNGSAPRVRVSMADLTRSERRKAKQAITTIIE